MTRSRTALLVQIDAEARIFAHALLQCEGYRVMEAEEFAEALRYVRTGRIDLLVRQTSSAAADDSPLTRALRSAAAAAGIEVRTITASREPGISARLSPPFPAPPQSSIDALRRMTRPVLH